MHRRWILLITLGLGIVCGILASKYYELTQLRAEEDALKRYHQAREELKDLKDPLLIFSKVAEVVKPSVVNISTLKNVTLFYEDFFWSVPRKLEQKQVGSGVIVDKDGYILTNYHVVADADEIKVTLSDKREFKGKVVGRDEPSDLAVVKIKANNLIPAVLGDSDKVNIGSWVVAIGNPYGLEQTVTSGIISARREAFTGEGNDFIQTDAAINPGNSGGPLVNLQGEVIGINSFIFTRSGGYQGIGFAIPSNRAKKIMEKLIETGKIRHPYLGVSLGELNDTLARSYDLAGLADLLKALKIKEPKGAFVISVVKNSPADKCGLMDGDVITRYNDKIINSPADLLNAIKKSKVEDVVTLTVIHNGKEKTLKVTIGERD